MTWTAPEPDPVDEPLVGPERPLLEGALDDQRATLLRICAGLSAEQLAARPLPSSDLSLLGLLRHLAKVERIWFRERLAGEDVPRLFEGDDDFALGTAGEAERAVAVLLEEVAAARVAVRDLGLDATCHSRDGQELSLRRVLVHVIAEYARHNGHADLLRQAVDGVTGR